MYASVWRKRKFERKGLNACNYLAKEKKKIATKDGEKLHLKRAAFIC